MTHLARYALTISATALLVGCGGQSPIFSAPSLTQQPAVRQNLALATSRSYKVLYDFKGSSGMDGAQPQADLTNVNGVLYGTTASGGKGCGSTAGCGTVFAITRRGKERIIYRFKGQPDGATPAASLLLFNGALYGTTGLGGTSNYGTVFRVPASGVEQVLHSFQGGADGLYPAGGLIGIKGTLYGSTYLTIFKITPEGKESVLHTFQSLYDGRRAVGSLVNLKGALYGATVEGGSHCEESSNGGCGTVFSITTSGVERVIHSFKGGKRDGSYPDAGLTELNGVLYGTTAGGGKFDRGTVFAVTTSGKESLLHSFSGPPDGDSPIAALTAFEGSLYGTTSKGGTGRLYSDGTIFRVTTSGAEQLLYSFGGTPDGADPRAGVTVLNGGLYGVTEAGGSCQSFYQGCGIVFRIAP